MHADEAMIGGAQLFTPAIIAISSDEIHKVFENGSCSF